MQVPVLETQRLLLRPWRASDAEAMFAYAQDPEVGPNAGWKPHQSLEESRERAARWAQGEDADWLWAITVKGEEDRPVGSLGLHEHNMRSTLPGSRELGYVLARSHWGRGFMTEAARAALDYAFAQQHLPLITVGHYPFNHRSRRVIEKLGFTYEGTLRRTAVRFDGLVLDECVFSMTAADYWLLRARRQGLSLVLPEELDREAILAYQEEWDEDEATPWAAHLRGRSFEAWLARSIAWREQADPGYSTAHTWFLVGEDGALLGALDLRHELNEKLLRDGGHIGYGVRPRERGKKLAPCMLALGLEKAKERGIPRVLVCCDEDNPASARTIEDCGGLLENTFPEEDGSMVRRYWITL